MKLPTGKVVATPIKLYWSSGLKDGKKNFGDWLGPALVKQLSGRDVEHAPASQADLISVGSVLQKLNNYWWKKKVLVWGSGFIEPPKTVLSRHTVCAIRGKFSAKHVSSDKEFAYGDPGLLSTELLPEYQSIKKTCALGIIPHYKDQIDPAFKELAGRFKNSKLINVLDEPLTVLREIASCEKVVSSSLHGLVVADSFGIPSQWLKAGDRVRGNDFKFFDYYSVFDIESPVFKSPDQINETDIENMIRVCPPEKLANIQETLKQSFPFLK